MKKILILAALGLAAAASATPAAAQINRREHNQQQRIANGVRTGQLTPREAARAEGQQARIARAERRMRASGGRLTFAERRRLQQRQNHASRFIYRQKHDRQGRRW